MEIAGMGIFMVLGALACWQMVITISGRVPGLLIKIISSVLGIVAGGLLYRVLANSFGGLISSMVTAILAGVLLLVLMGFFKKA